MSDEHAAPEASAAPASRRQVEYTSLAAFLSDAEFLAAHPHVTVGNWSYGRILQHLTDAINCSFDGFPFRSNIFIRFIARTFLKRKLLTTPMQPGFKLPKQVEAEYLPADTIPVAEALDNLRRAIARFENDDPQASHPALGALTPQEWVQLHLRHAAMHMSFVRPA